MAEFDHQMVTAFEHPARARLLLRGEFDLSNAAALTRCIRDAGWASRLVELDMSDVTFIDSSGLQAMLVAQRTLRDAGGDVVIVAASRSVNVLLRLADHVHAFDPKPGSTNGDS